MTVIRPNSITGVTSITAQGTELTLHRSDGSILDELKSNINASSGVSTIANLDGTNINASGIVTAASFVGDGSGLTGVASTDNINTDTTATFNGNVSIADSIIHTGDTDTSIRFPTAGTFTIHTQGSERLRVGGSGLIGIGTDSPDVQLDIVGSGPVTKIRAHNQTNSRLRIQAGNTSSSFLEFGDSDDADVGEIVYDHSDNHMHFNTNAGERLRIDSSGDVGIGTAAPRSALDLAEKTDAVALPQGTTAQRPTGDNPYLRWNTTNSALEFYNGTDWVEIISDYFPSGSAILG